MKHNPDCASQGASGGQGLEFIPCDCGARPEPGAWWGWSVAMAQYHLARCDWVTTGELGQHCSCGLSRHIAKLLREPRA